MTTTAATVELASAGIRRRAARFAALVGTHPIVDAYANFVAPLIGVLEVRCELEPWQTASLLSIGSLTSGLCQPVFAWLTDRFDSRIFAAIGLFLAAVCLSSIGLADSYATLVVLFAVGMMGVGAFHPIAAATVGQLAAGRRSAGVTIFFVAGMLGAAVGPIVSTRVAAIGTNGFDLLRWLMVPGIIGAMVLHVAIRSVPHRHDDHLSFRFEPDDLRRRWWTVFALFVANAMRYTVNMVLLYLVVRWAERLAETSGVSGEAAIAKAGSLDAGLANTSMMIGMGAGGFVVGLLARPGREKWALVLVPLVLGPTIALFPRAGLAGGCLLSFAAGVGFAAVIPVTIGLGQRLLPHRTSLASSLMMGGAWAVAMVGPLAAEAIERRHGLQVAFTATAALLVLSGLTGLVIPGRRLREWARIDGRPAAS